MPEENSEIEPAQCVNHRVDTSNAEDLLDDRCSGTNSFHPSNDDTRGGQCVPGGGEGEDINPPGPQLTGRGPGEPRAVRRVQHLNCHARGRPSHTRNGDRRARHPSEGERHKQGTAAEGYADVADTNPVQRLFQKRYDGSGIGQPDSTRCMSRW